MMGVCYPAFRVASPSGEVFFIEKGKKIHGGRPIIALDFSSFDDVGSFLALFPADGRLHVKIDMELYYAAEPEIVRHVKSLGRSIFLDLKLYDVPNTVKSAIRVLSDLGIDMTSVHAAGGVEMMRAAREGPGQGPKLIAVTQLTSALGKQMRADQNVQTSLAESVLHHAKRANGTGLDSVVCSAREVAVIRDVTSEDFVCLTPGIHPTGAAVGDQKRMMTPNQTSAIGSSYIVVRHPITKADDPVAAYKAIYSGWNTRY